MHGNRPVPQAAPVRNPACTRAALPAPALPGVSDPDAGISPDACGPQDRSPDQVPTPSHVAVHLRGAMESPGPKPRCARLSMRPMTGAKPESPPGAPDQREDVGSRDAHHEADAPARPVPCHRARGRREPEPEQAAQGPRNSGQRRCHLPDGAASDRPGRDGARHQLPKQTPAAPQDGLNRGNPAPPGEGVTFALRACTIVKIS